MPSTVLKCCKVTRLARGSLTSRTDLAQYDTTTPVNTAAAAARQLFIKLTSHNCALCDCGSVYRTSCNCRLTITLRARDTDRK